MPKGIVYDGEPSAAELAAAPGIPDQARKEQGVVAVLECVQEIPCNPCERACPRQAIIIGEPMTNLPQLRTELCNGCGVCVAACPGQAIFIENINYTGESGMVAVPYEYLPLPEKGQQVHALNRRGEIVTEAKVVKIRNLKAYDHTVIVYLELPKQYVSEVRALRV